VYTQTAPPATPAASSPQGALTPERRESLAAFYKKHDQTKLKDVDEILSMYEFSATVSSLKAKYGEVPPGWEESQTNAERLRFVNQKHDPSKIAQVQTILANYDFVETVKSLQTRYGELPDGWGSYPERVFDSVSETPKNLIVEASKESTVVVKCKAGTTVRWAYAKNVDEQVDIGFEVTLDVHRQGLRQLQ